jgi:hypothetical protein
MVPSGRLELVHVVPQYSCDTKKLCIMSMETNWCAAKELCICLTAAADARHVCPACQSAVHAICGEVCEDARICITQPAFRVTLDTKRLLKALTTSSFMSVALQLPK